MQVVSSIALVSEPDWLISQVSQARSLHVGQHYQNHYQFLDSLTHSLVIRAWEMSDHVQQTVI